MIIPTYEANADRSRQLYLTYREQDHATPHFHDAMELVICVKGEFNALIGGDKIILHAGDIAVVDSYDVHSYKAEDVGAYIAVISRSYLDEFRQLYNKTFPKFLPKTEGADAIIDLVRISHANDVNSNSMLRQGFVSYLLGLLVQNYKCTRVRNTSDDRCVKILLYIDEHYSENLSLASISEHFGYAPNYFSSIFNRYMGMSLHDYINSVRIHKLQQLNAVSLKITQLAPQCGFDSLNTYYRALKKYGNNN